MTYPQVTQFQTIDNRRRLAFSAGEEAPKPSRARRRLQFPRRRRLEACTDR